MTDPGSRRRAKIKLLTKRSMENGEDCDAMPESMRQYLAMKALESGKHMARSFLGPSAGPMAAYGSGDIMLRAEPTNPGKVGM